MLLLVVCGRHLLSTYFKAALLSVTFLRLQNNKVLAFLSYFSVFYLLGYKSLVKYGIY